MKFYRKLKPITAISLSIFFICLIFTVALGIITGIPSEYNIQVGDEYSLQTRFPFSINLNNISHILEVNESDNIADTLLTNIFKIKTYEKGSTDLQLKILGLIPYKTKSSGKTNIFLRVISAATTFKRLLPSTITSLNV